MPCPVMRGGLRFMLKGAEESEVVDRGVGLAENERQLRRIDERRPAEGVEQLSFGGRHVLSLRSQRTRSGQCTAVREWRTPGLVARLDSIGSKVVR